MLHSNLNSNIIMRFPLDNNMA